MSRCSVALVLVGALMAGPAAAEGPVGLYCLDILKRPEQTAGSCFWFRREDCEGFIPAHLRVVGKCVLNPNLSSVEGEWCIINENENLCLFQDQTACEVRAKQSGGVCLPRSQARVG